MTTFPGSPKVLKGGLVLIDADTAQVQRIISLQYNPDSVTRTLQVQAAGAEAGQRSEPLRFKGPAVETIKLDAEIDATDQLEFPDQNRAAVESGIQPQLAVLESLANPTSAQLLRVDSDASSRHAGDRAHAGAPHPLRLGQEPDRAGAPHRLLHHRGGLRSGPQPDPRQGEPRPSRAVGRRPRLLAARAAACS